MNAITVFDPKTTVSATLKSGAVSTRVMSRKEFKESRGLGNAESKRAYPLYLKEMGMASNAVVGGMLAGGAMFCVKANVAVDGTMKATFLPAGHKSLAVKEGKMTVKVSQLKAATDEIAALKAQLAALSAAK